MAQSKIRDQSTSLQGAETYQQKKLKTYEEEQALEGRLRMIMTTVETISNVGGLSAESLLGQTLAYANTSALRTSAVPGQRFVLCNPCAT